jgi:hypothetical protein
MERRPSVSPNFGKEHWKLWKGPFFSFMGEYETTFHNS